LGPVSCIPLTIYTQEGTGNDTLGTKVLMITRKQKKCEVTENQTGAQVMDYKIKQEMQNSG